MGFGSDCCRFCITAVSDGSPSRPLPELRSLLGILFPQATPEKGRRVQRDLRLSSDKCSSAIHSYSGILLPQLLPYTTSSSLNSRIAIIFWALTDHPSVHRYSSMSVKHRQDLSSLYDTATKPMSSQLFILRPPQGTATDGESTTKCPEPPEQPATSGGERGRGLVVSGGEQNG